MTVKIPEGTRIVVANGASARVFTNVGSDSALTLKQEDDLRTQDMSDAGISGQGPSGVTPPDMSITQANEATFAKQVAVHLNEEALNQRFQHLVLVADPITLGRIRPLLHKETQARLILDLAKDYTNSPIGDIEQALGKVD